METRVTWQHQPVRADERTYIREAAAPAVTLSGIVDGYVVVNGKVCAIVRHKNSLLSIDIELLTTIDYVHSPFVGRPYGA